MRWLHTLLCVAVVVEQCVADAPIAILSGLVRASSKLSEAGVTVDYVENAIKIEMHNALEDGSAGHVRYSSRLQPNGYYIIPVYDAGKYVLKCKLEGWSFAPDQLPVDVTNPDHGDGTQFENLNFEFTGFSVSGHVSGSARPSCKDTAAPKGVVLSLVKAGVEMGSTETEESGKFTFENIPPGKYSVKASSDEFKLEGSTQEVEVAGPNTQLAKAIHVVGYSLSGSVVAGEAAVEGVNVFLYSGDEEVTCENQSSDFGVLPDRTSKPSCLATSSKSGSFSFQYLPCGEYTLVPHYKEQFSENSDSVTSFDVSPQELLVNLGHKSLTLDEQFQVVGFSASGRVVDERGGGVRDAKVFVDGKLKATTNENGYYSLAGMTTGSYKIEAQKEHLVFKPLANVELTPQAGVTANIELSAYHLCGSVHSAESLGDRVIELSPKIGGNGKSQATKTDASGAYCFEAAPGEYIVSAVVTPSEEKRGLLLSPTDQTVKVAGKAVLDVDFSQAKVSIAGSLQCRAGCPSDIPVSLHNTRTEKTVRQTVDAASGTFAFNEVLPGKYVVSINYDRFCWEKSSHNVQVNLEDATGIKFTQTGFLMSVDSQVPITLRSSLVPAHTYANVKHAPDSTLIRDDPIEKGQNTICLPSQGMYKLEPISCYKFAGFGSGGDAYKFDTDKETQKSVQLKVTHYQVNGSIEVPKATPFSGQLALSIVSPKRSSSDNVVYARKSDGETPKEDAAAADLYEFSFWAEEREEIELVPHVSDPSDKSGLLFYPRKLAVRVWHPLTCQVALTPFNARKGIFVTGKVTPNVEGVQITVDYTTGKTPSTVVETDKNGDYVAGPLYDDVPHQILASKSGYHLKKDLNNAGSFTAMELGKIEVRVVAPGDVPVESALLAISGSGETPFSSNAQTNKDGVLRFTDLTPGVYYLQPLLKEYEFEPEFSQVAIESGTSAVEQFNARRVAYSAFGSVRSLNGKAERGAKVHATAYAEDGKQVIHHEEGTVDESGDFRIRGLNPSFEYKINVDTRGATNRIARATPDEVIIQVENKDHLGLEFVAFRHLNKFDVSGHVDNFQAKSPYPIKVTLSSKHLKESVTIDDLNYFEFPSLPASDIYQLSYSRGADTPQGRIENRRLDTIELIEHSHVAVRAPKLTIESHDDLSETGLLGLIVVTIGIFAWFNRSSFARVYSDISDARSEGNGGGGGGGQRYDDDQKVSSPTKKRRTKRRT